MPTSRARVGSHSRVLFDASKKEFVIIHPVFGNCPSFKYFCCQIDSKLTMDAEVNRIVTKRKLKIKAILRTQGFYGVPDLIRQFKSHVWPILEGTCGAISHASETHLRRIGNMQRSLTRERGLSEESAFLDHNFCANTIAQAHCNT